MEEIGYRPNASWPTDRGPLRGLATIGQREEGWKTWLLSGNSGDVGRTLAHEEGGRDDVRGDLGERRWCEATEGVAITERVVV